MTIEQHTDSPMNPSVEASEARGSGLMPPVVNQIALIRARINQNGELLECLAITSATVRDLGESGVAASVEYAHGVSVRSGVTPEQFAAAFGGAA